MKNFITDLKVIIFIIITILGLFAIGWRSHELFTKPECPHTCEQCEWEEYLEYEQQFYKDRDAGKFN